MDLRLSGRRALVSGGSKGIGFASAKLLAQEGCDVVLVSRNAADLERAKAEIEAGASRRRIEIEACDLSQDEVPVRLAERYGGRIDILVNNAGAIPGGTLGDIDQARWRAAWELKLFGYIGMTRAFYARMAERKSGVIVNVIGAAGERMSASYIAGSTANAGLMAFTRAHSRARRSKPDRWGQGRRRQSRTSLDRTAGDVAARACQEPPRRSGPLARDADRPALRTRRDARRDRRHGGLPRFRSVGLYDRHDRHDRWWHEP